MIAFNYVEPANLAEALAALARYGDEVRPIAGGTGLVNLMKQRLVQPAQLLGLRRLTELGRMSFANELTIGAICTLRELENSPLVLRHAPLLAEAARRVASIRIRSIATIGGALAHADPNEDLPPALIALDARVRVRSHNRVRELPVSELFSGYYETVLELDELLTEVVIPAQPPDSGVAFLKFLPQSQDDYATVAVAARLTLKADRIGQLRVALGGVAPTPLRAQPLEVALTGQVPTSAMLREASALVAEMVDPLSDFRGSADYKREMAVVFTLRAITQALATARGIG
jgi:aerobic carbon-monoxide dehydrogenase medium subunit